MVIYLKIVRNFEKVFVGFIGLLFVIYVGYLIDFVKYNNYDSVFLLLDDEDEYEGEFMILPEERCVTVMYNGTEQSLTVTGELPEGVKVAYGKGNTDPTIGDCHLTWWFRGAENIDQSWFDIVGRMATESAIEGYPLPTSLRKFLSEDDILDRDSDVIEYHIKNNMYFEPAGLLSVHNRLKKSAEVVVVPEAHHLSYLRYRELVGV